MKVKKELDPKLGVLTSGTHYIYLWYQGKRYRFNNGKIINQDIYPNHLPIEQRTKEAQVLLIAFTLAVRKGWVPEVRKAKVKKQMRVSEIASKVLQRKLSLDYSKPYKNDLKRTVRLWNSYIEKEGIKSDLASSLNTDVIADFIFKTAVTPASKANLKRNISALLKDELESLGVVINLRSIKLPKRAQELHKPIADVPGLLEEIKAFNDNLHLCCLMTYTMLLRPHREIRCLSFSDFNEDFTQLSLGGQRVKSKRNRILPVPDVVRLAVIDRYKRLLNREFNLFSCSFHIHHDDYFKGLWSKYKVNSALLKKQQTLYSFRHTGAIRVFQKTGSLQKLQQVLGHSDMKVSLTYLRGLEVKQLDVEDLPELN